MTRKFDMRVRCACCGCYGEVPFEAKSDARISTASLMKRAALRAAGYRCKCGAWQGAVVSLAEAGKAIRPRPVAAAG